MENRDKNLRIVLIEDSAVNIYILKKLLKSAGYGIDTATNGDAGLELVRNTKPDIILLDILMPGKDGYEVLSILKKKTVTKDIPVIMITALSGGKDIEKALQLGAVDYIIKPFTDSEVKARIASALKLRHSILALETTNREKEKLIIELQEALSKVKLLSGFLPICANCKKIRDDKGYWKQVEQYIHEHSEAEFSHGICPDCSKKLYPELY